MYNKIGKNYFKTFNEPLSINIIYSIRNIITRIFYFIYLQLYTTAILFSTSECGVMLQQ